MKKLNNFLPVPLGLLTFSFLLLASCFISCGVNNPPDKPTAKTHQVGLWTVYEGQNKALWTGTHSNALPAVVGMANVASANDETGFIPDTLTYDNPSDGLHMKMRVKKDFTHIDGISYDAVLITSIDSLHGQQWLDSTHAIGALIQGRNAKIGKPYIKNSHATAAINKKHDQYTELAMGFFFHCNEDRHSPKQYFYYGWEGDRQATNHNAYLICKVNVGDIYNVADDLCTEQ
jgi:hypothetical protein